MQEPMPADRSEGRGAHLRLLQGGKARTVPAAFAYPRSAALTYDTTGDARTRETVCDALRRDDALDASGIDVYVANGEVTLIGMVSGLRDERIAVEIAEGCDGVREAVSQLQLAGDGEADAFMPPVA
jgi:hypothetical protein